MDNKTLYWNLYKDLWGFHKEHCDDEGTDEQWERISRESDALQKKYEKAGAGEFALKMILDVVMEIEQKQKESPIAKI